MAFFADAVNKLISLGYGSSLPPTVPNEQRNVDTRARQVITRANNPSTAPVAPTVTPAPANTDTRFIVKCDVGFGNHLEIRGQGLNGLSWEKGIKFTKVPGDADTWELNSKELYDDSFQKNRAARFTQIHSTDHSIYQFKFVIVTSNGEVKFETGDNRTNLSRGLANPAPKFS